MVMVLDTWYLLSEQNVSVRLGMTLAVHSASVRLE